MKKLLTIVFLTAGICSAGDYDRFAKTGRALVNGVRQEVTYYRAWAECTVEFLNESIPQEALAYFYGERVDEEGGAVAHEPVTLKDFILGEPIYSIDGTTCIITLAARNGLMYRTMFVTEQDMAVWDQYLTGYDRPSRTWLDEDQRAALLESDAYRRDEE
jgi:hypothetical protein